MREEFMLRRLPNKKRWVHVREFHQIACYLHGSDEAAWTRFSALAASVLVSHGVHVNDVNDYTYAADLLWDGGIGEWVGPHPQHSRLKPPPSIFVYATRLADDLATAAAAQPELIDRMRAAAVNPGLGSERLAALRATILELTSADLDASLAERVEWLRLDLESRLDG